MDRKWWTLIAVCVGTFMLLLDVTIVNVALPDIRDSLDASFSSLQWVIDAYALTLAALLLMTGALADRYGRRLVFVVGLLVFVTGSLLCGVATTPLFLDLSRGFQGIGGAAMFSTALALLAGAFEGRERGVAFGIWGGITGVAVAAGPVIGGVLIEILSWRWVFLVNVPIGAIALVIVVARVEESKAQNAHRPDVVGFVTFSAALASLVYALIESEREGWGSTVVVSCLAAAVVLMVAFLVSQRLQRHPMVDLALFKTPTFVGGSLAAFALSSGLFALLAYITLYFQGPLGYSALGTGVRFLVLSGGILLTSTLAGRLTNVVPIRFLIGPGLLLVGIGLLLMRGLGQDSDWTHFIPGFIAAGIGAGLINPPLASTAVGVVEPARSGMASGMNSTFRQVGIATGIAALGSIFSSRVGDDVVSGLQNVRGVSSEQASSLGDAASGGAGLADVTARLPVAVRGPFERAVSDGYANGLDTVFLIGAVVMFVAALAALVLIRTKDFHASAAGGGAAGRPPATASDDAVPPAEGAPVAGDEGRGSTPHTNGTGDRTATVAQPAAAAGTGSVAMAPERVAAAVGGAGAARPAPDEVAALAPAAPTAGAPATTRAPATTPTSGPEEGVPAAPAIASAPPAAIPPAAPTAPPAPAAGPATPGAGIPVDAVADGAFSVAIGRRVAEHRAAARAAAEARTAALLAEADRSADELARRLHEEAEGLLAEHGRLRAELADQEGEAQRAAAVAAATRARLAEVSDALRGIVEDDGADPRPEMTNPDGA